MKNYMGYSGWKGLYNANKNYLTQQEINGLLSDRKTVYDGLFDQDFYPAFWQEDGTICITDKWAKCYSLPIIEGELTYSHH
jgi:hypothetical protein